MTQFKYLEMRDGDGLDLEPEQVLRLMVADDDEAIQKYEDYKVQFDDTKLKAVIVDGEHFEDSTLNKPCVKRDINDVKADKEKVK